MHFQQHLRREREMRGWSQARMAQELGTTPNTISIWERGVSLPSPYFRVKLYELLGKNALELGLLEEDDTSAEVVVEQPSKVEPEIRDLEGTSPSQSHEVTQTVQGRSALEVMTSTALVWSKQRKEASQTVRSTGFMSQAEHRMSWLDYSPGRRRFLIAVVCVSLLIVGGMVLFALSHLLISSNPYAPHKGSLILNDPLADQNPQINWQEGWNANHASCQFKEGTYHAFQPRQGYFHACIAQLTGFRNFAYEVEMVLLQGDYAGMIFRAVNSLDSHYYLFRVKKDGSYMLKRYIDGTDNNAIVMDTGLARAFHSGYGQKNRLAVVADDDHLTLYINGQDLATVSDAAYTQGQIGVVVGSEQQVPAEASFSNVRVWVS